MSEIVEKPVAKDMICIRPYVDNTVENMGLEKYNMVLHQGATHKEWLTCIEISKGVRRYLTGLDEFAPEIEKLKNKEEKEAKIKQIREKVIYIERLLIGNDKLKVADKDFWEKVQIVKRDNHEFWKDIFIVVGNDTITLDETNPNDLILISCIEARGFSEVSPSFEDARSSSNSYRWYLDKRTETSVTKVSGKLVKNKALSILHALYENNPSKLWYIAKCVDVGSSQYKAKTPPAVIYENMDNYINGLGTDKASKSGQLFIDASELDQEELRVKAVVKDAAFYRLLVHKPDGVLYHASSGEALDKNLAGCVQKLKNPMNADLWKKIVEEVEVYW